MRVVEASQTLFLMESILSMPPHIGQIDAFMKLLYSDSVTDKCGVNAGEAHLLIFLSLLIVLVMSQARWLRSKNMLVVAGRYEKLVQSNSTFITTKILEYVE